MSPEGADPPPAGDLRVDPVLPVPLPWASRVRVPWWSQALDLLAGAVVSGVTLALLSPAAPTFGAFELLLVQTASTREASGLVLQALQEQGLAEELSVVALATVALALPLLLVRHLEWGRTAQAAVAATSAAAWLAASVAGEAPLGQLPTSGLAALLLAGALAGVGALDLCDRLVRRLRRRPAPSRAVRRRLPAALALVALLATTTALVTPYPWERPRQLRDRLRAATTSDPARLEALTHEDWWSSWDVGAAGRDGVDAPAGGTNCPPAGEPGVEPEAPPEDDLAASRRVP